LGEVVLILRKKEDLLDMVILFKEQITTGVDHGK